MAEIYYFGHTSACQVVQLLQASKQEKIATMLQRSLCLSSRAEQLNKKHPFKAVFHELFSERSFSQRQIFNDEWMSFPATV